MNEENKDIEVYLEEIAEKLYSGHATLMIGAGFSKNAKPNSPNCKKFSTWDELGCEFYKKVYGKEPSENEHYLDVLKLASEVDAAFGRSVLNQIIKNSNPDSSYSPSDLHKKLLSLPWVDVFTTNYDTLLERTAVDNTNRKYNVIVNKSDLVNSQRPRIIKLHGSFPSTTPFIITEEDFRIYPTDFAPFVNTVQQSLLENTMILIGFSGDDPNFLKWIGWIRDNLGTNIPKMYMIGSFNYSSAQQKLFDKRNITIVNINSQEENKHYGALNIFLDYLIQKNIQLDITTWADGCKYRFFDANISTEQNITKIIQEWRTLRLSYPGWVILPLNKRNKIYSYTEDWFSSTRQLKDLDRKIKYNFVYELVWRLEKCLYPLNEDIIELIDEVLQDKKLDSNDIFLLIHKIKYFRLFGLNEDCESTIKYIEENIKLCSLQEIAELSFQKCLLRLYSLDTLKLEEELNKWIVESSLPFYEAKKAGILAEIGDINSAIELLQKAIKDVRILQNDSKQITDVTLLSEESYILNLYQSVLFASSSNLKKNENIDYSSQYQKYTEGLKVLRKYYCDPISEESYFKNALYQEYKEIPQDETVVGFDLNQKSTLHHFSIDKKELRKAFNFVLYLEEIGSPISIHDRSCHYNIFVDEITASLKRLFSFYPYLCISLLCRTSTTKIVDEFITRNWLEKLSCDEADSLCRNFISVLNENYEKINSSEVIDDRTNFGMKMANVLPEIISRFSSKCSFECKEDILSLIYKIYSAQKHNLYRKKEVLLSRLLESLSLDEQRILIEKICFIPVANNYSLLEERECIVPATFLSRYNNFDSTLESSKTEYLFNLLEEEREYLRGLGFDTLNYLYLVKLLNEKDKKKLEKITWMKVDDVGLPILKENILKCNLLFNYPQLEKIKLRSLLKEYILKEITKDLTQLKDIDALLGELAYSINELIWNEDEIKKIEAFVYYALELLEKRWEEKLSSSFDSEYTYRIKIIIVKLGSKKLVDDSIIDKYIETFSKMGIPSIEIKVLKSKIDDIEGIKKQLIINLSTDFNESYTDSLRAIKLLNKRNEKDLEEFILFANQILINNLIFSFGNGYISLINTVICMIEEQTFVVNDSISNGIICALERLKEFFSHTKKFENLTFEDILSIKASAVRLAYAIYMKNKREGVKQDNILEEWHKISQNKNEFSDVRKQWGLIPEGIILEDDE